MEKLKEISSGKNNKSCSIIHHESNKIGLHFSDFFVIVYAIYKIRQICVTIGVTFLQIRPWKELNVCNVALGLPAGAGCRNPARPTALAGRERAGEGPRGSRVRFGALDGVEELLAGGAPVARGGGRRGCSLAGEGGSVERKGEATSTYACQRGCWWVELGKIAGRAGYSLWRPLMAPAAVRLAAGERRPSP
jgi:hypothetical protein